MPTCSCSWKSKWCQFQRSQPLCPVAHWIRVTNRWKLGRNIPSIHRQFENRDRVAISNWEETEIFDYAQAEVVESWVWSGRLGHSPALSAVLWNLWRSMAWLGLHWDSTGKTKRFSLWVTLKLRFKFTNFIVLRLLVLDKFVCKHKPACQEGQQQSV